MVKDNIYEKYEIPDNFEIIDKELLDLILKDINTKMNIHMSSNYNFKILSFSDNKIFVNDGNNRNSLYYIYSVKYNKYELEYIVIFKKK